MNPVPPPARSAPERPLNADARGSYHNAPLSPNQLAQVAKSLGHPSRVAIVARLARAGPCSTTDIVAGAGLAHSTVFRHLRILSEAGVVTAFRDGSRVWYEVDNEVLGRFRRAVDGLALEGRLRLGT